ncbi:head decoration protein [Desulfosarcina sp. OttesenSCG-928-G10]|nr:head decoration protein [Desulfosarcina sp. OttesenSCG-928-G10]
MAKALSVYSEDAPRSLSEVLLLEVNRNWSRDTVTLAATTVDLPVGAVLAVNEDGTYVSYLAAAGNNEAAAMLVTPRIKSTAAQEAVVIRRGARVSASGLAFLATVTDAQKQTAYAQLTALGIVVEA